jgi:uncharacterized protein YndB with AHSA1/START domain
MTLPYGNSRSIELAQAVAAPARDVFRALTEPEQIERWFGRTANGFTRPGGHLDLLLGPEDLGLEERDPLRLSITFREIQPHKLVLLDVTDRKTGRPQPLQIDLREHADKTVLTLTQTGFDPSAATEAMYLASVRAWNFHLANLKSVLETGVDLRRTIHGEIFRFEGTAVARGLRWAHAEAQLPGPRAAAFHAFTDREALASWWPGEFTIDSGSEPPSFAARIALGAGEPLDVRGRIVAYTVPQKLRLEYEETTPAGPLEAAALVCFIEETEDSSRAVVVERSAAPAAVWRVSLGGSVPGWDGILSRLARHVALL